MQDNRLIIRCLQQDRLAQAKLYRQYAPYSLAVIRRFGISASYEADLLQDIFIEIFAKLKQYDAQKGSFTTWLRRITVFRIIDLQRRKDKLNFQSLDAPESLDIPDSSEDISNFPPAYLLDAIRQLPSGYRTVFNLYAVEGFSHDKIGQLLSISAAGSRSQYHRARKILQTTLSKKNLIFANETF